MIKTKAINLPIILYVLFLLILPALGKTHDFVESLFFNVGVLILAFNYLHEKSKHASPATPILFQLILIILFAISTILSQNIGSSYYAFFRFIAVLVLINISTTYFSLKLFLKGTIVFGLLYSLIFWLNKTGLIQLPIQQASDNFILQIWGHSYMADFIIFPLIYALHLLNVNPKKLLPLLAVFFLFITLYATNSRSGILAFLVGAVIYLVRARPTNKMFYLFPLICLILLIVVNLNLIRNPTNKYFLSSRPIYWQEAYQGFIRSPFFGLGPYSFVLDHSRISLPISEQTPYVHNSFLQFLYENGLIFTLLLFAFIAYRVYSHQQDHLLFSLNIASIIHSFLDPTWNSVGIMTISFVLLTYRPPFLSSKSQSGSAAVYMIVLIIVFLLFAVSKTSSDYFYLKGDYSFSLKLDPFNLNSLLKTIQDPQVAVKTLKVYSKEPILLQNIVDLHSPADFTTAYLDHLRINMVDPRTIRSLINYYLTSNNPELIILLDKYYSYFHAELDNRQTIADLYLYSQKHYSSNPQYTQKIINYLTQIDPEEGHFYITLANILWQGDRQKEAIQILQDCAAKNSSPSTQCREYLESHQNTAFDPPFSPDFISYFSNYYANP